MKRKTKQEKYENCQHAFWVEDLDKEGYRCACFSKLKEEDYSIRIRFTTISSKEGKNG